jgi:hypothetical protein
MRKFAWLLAVVGLAVPAGVMVAQTASAAPVVTCATNGVTATATISPGIPKLKPAAQAETGEIKVNITTGTSGKLAHCSGLGVTGGTFTSSFKVQDPTNCNSVVDNSEPAASPPTTGPVVITWSAGKGKTTIGVATLGAATPPSTGKLHVGGKVTASTGAVASLVGKTLSLDVSFKAVPSSGCVTTDLVKATTTNYKPLTIG